MARTLKSATALAATDCPAPSRAATYLRVSTGRGAEGEVSIPSQRDLTTRHCLSNGWNTGRVYAYYTCASRTQKGSIACGETQSGWRSWMNWF